MTIMVAGGLTFAIPSTVPDAHAQTPNLYVSAVNPAFDNTFGGLQVIQVIVSDPLVNDKGDPEPRVTVDGNEIAMYQGNSGGVWYTYFMSIEDAGGELYVTGSTGYGKWNGVIPTISLIREHPSDTSLNIYEFDLDGDFDVVYHKPGAPQTVTLTYDDSTNNAINVDRTSYPRNAHVHVEVTDHVLNIDPTDVDVWKFSVADGSYNYLLGDRDTTGSRVASAEDLGCEDDNCKFSIENIVGTGASDTNNILTLDGSPTEYTLEETGANTGVFTITNDDESIIMTQDDAPRGQNTDIMYSDETATVFTSFNTAAIQLDIEDGTWNSGEPIGLTVTDADQNMNSQVDEDQTIDNPDARIPIFMTGDPGPYTLADGFNPPQGMDNMDIYAYTVGTDAEDITYTKTTSNTVVRLDYQVDDSHRGIISLDEDQTLTTPRIAIPFGTFGELRKSINDDKLDDDGEVTSTFVGRNLINYDFSVFEDAGIRSDIMLVDDNGAVIRYGTVGLTADALNAFDQQADIRDLTGWGLAPPNARNNLVISGPEILDEDNIDANTKVMLVLTLSSDLEIEEGDRYPIVADFFSFGFYGDGAQANERVANQIIRVEVEETGDNTSTFTGTLEYVMINQLDAAVDDAFTLTKDNVYANIEPISNEATFIAFEGLTDSDARVNYNDVNSNGVDSIVSAQQDITTSTGVVSLSAGPYRVGSNVVITLEDGDLNTDSDSAESYTVAVVGDTNVDATTANTGDGSRADPDRDQVGIGVATANEDLLPGKNSLGMLLEVTFDDKRWQADPRATTDDDNIKCALGGLGASGFTLLETGVATGVFTGSFEIPKEICNIDDNGKIVTNNDGDHEPIQVSGKDIGVTYVDFRDASGQIVTVGDSAAIGASTGSISLDRTVYPVPFGASSDDGDSMFKEHSNAEGDELIPEGKVKVIIKVNDPDYNLNPSGEDKINELDSTPVKVTISRSGDEHFLGYAGGTTAVDKVPAVMKAQTALNTAKKALETSTTALNTGGATGAEIADQIAKQTDVDAKQATYDAERKKAGGDGTNYGTLTEISPDSGIFEVSVDLAHGNGPESTDCPDDSNCILQGDIITVEYTDPTDASGNKRTVTDSATFDLRTGSLQTDKSVYVIGTDMIVTLIDPDLNLDSTSEETYPLDIINWDSDADSRTISDSVFSAEPGSLREQGENSGIFQVVLSVPEAIGGDRLERGEEITLEYTDYGPSGADFVGHNTEDISRTIFTSNFGATIELDQAVYTWTDKVFITITAPDHNLNSNQVDEIGNNDDYPIRVATRSDNIDQYTLVETGTNTGIFTGEVILTGFSYDADGESSTGDASGNDVTGKTCTTCNGPTDGMLPTDNDDGLEVSFEFSDGETVRQSALIRWNIGEIQWLEASYPATSSGVLRIIDPDMNLNPEAADNFEATVWSSSSPSGITLTVTETQQASGIFEGTVTFGLDTSSGGHKLSVKEGDTVTAKYDDNTLPAPYSKGDNDALTATTIIGTIVPPLERVGIESLRAVDATGATLSTISVDQQVQITTDLTNKQDKVQPFAYLVQIQDADGVTVSLSWIDGSLTPNQSFSPSQSWTPTAPGEYTVTVFAWESVSTPTALSPQQTTTITVN